MDFTLNGTPVSMDVRERATLLELLREGCGVMSVKDGCAPEGSCGACTVMVEGKAVVSCAQPATRAAGKSITTQEGLAQEERELWADSFVASGASQCGFCSPGIVMKAESLLLKNQDPSRDEVARALAGNLCRCTGYVKIIDAVQLAAKAKRGEGLPQVDTSGRVGSRTARYMGRELALGDKPYMNDIKEPGRWEGAALHPEATWAHDGNILSLSTVKRGDADAALTSAAHVVHETFRTQFIEHAFLEPESSLAVPEPDGGFHVYSQGQGAWHDREQVASFMGMPDEKIRVTQVSNGGAFGAKEDLNTQAHATLLAQKTGRPVKITLSRKESLRFHSKRHPLTMEYAVGCDDEGHLVAVKARIVGDTGAYASVGNAVLQRATGHSCSVYKVEN